VEPGVSGPVELAVEYPREVGADRIVKAVAAIELYGPPLIVVDLGTATTFDCIDSRGRFIGGAIAPGISTAANALLNRAARLFRVELVRPKDAIGRNTIHNVQSGLVYGWAGLVDGLIERMKAEMDGTPRVVATGGHAALIVNVSRSIQDVHEHLAFEGLRLLWERSRTA
jgi:type III pantothenate kinase